MTKIPKVSIIIPVFNAQDTICDCLDSILSLNYPKSCYEIVVINNASSDNTVSLLHLYKNEILILNEQQKGASAARNRGIIDCSHDIIAFTDSDCVVDENWLSEIISPLNQDNTSQDNIGIVGGKILASNPDNFIESFGETIHDHEKAINVLKPQYAITMNWASNKSVLKEAGLFDTSLLRGQDVDMSFKIYQLGYTIVYNPNAVVYHNNEDTLWGLFREGYTHGLWSVKLLRNHSDFLKPYGFKRINLKSYRKILNSLTGYLLGNNSQNSQCDFVFNLGKKFGKIHGSIVNLYVDL